MCGALPASHSQDDETACTIEEPCFLKTAINYDTPIDYYPGAGLAPGRN
jgi:hypothetical protein